MKFAQGKLAYERGQYPASARLLEQALNEEGPFTQLGGEIQLWLALAYQARCCDGSRANPQLQHPLPPRCLHVWKPVTACQSRSGARSHAVAGTSPPPHALPPLNLTALQACGREDDCLSVYRAVEKSHPLPAIRRQAADLRYIMEAPRLQINPEERVQIPVLTDLDVNRWAAPVCVCVCAWWDVGAGTSSACLTRNTRAVQGQGCRAAAAAAPGSAPGAGDGLLFEARR